MAAAEAEGAALGDAAEVGAGLGTGAAVVDGLGDAAPEQAAIAIARAGRSRETDRFMTGDFLRDLVWMGLLAWLIEPLEVFSTKCIVSSGASIARRWCRATLAFSEPRGGPAAVRGQGC